MEINDSIEARILDAAESVFLKKGKSGSSMQDIADEAGITRTSLNYYYRTKDKLFEAVFRKTMMLFVPKLAEIFQQAEDLKGYLYRLSEVVIDTMIMNPQIPVFVLQELSSNPNRMPAIIAEMGINPEQAINLLKQGADESSSLLFDPRHIIMNVISLSIFPFASKPVLLTLMFQGDEQSYLKAMQARKEVIAVLIDKMLNAG